jgi:PcfJ-like protein
MYVNSHMRLRDILLFESNILNINQIYDFTKQAMERARTPRVQQYIGKNLPPYIKKSYNRTTAVTTAELYNIMPHPPEWAQKAAEKGELANAILDDQLFETINGVIDYLESDEGQKINLARYPLSTAIIQSSRWHQSLANQTTTTNNVTAESQHVLKTYTNGYSWVKLLKPDALDYESSCMGHCVGRGSYDSGVAKGTTTIVSFRDANNQPHVTVEITNNQVEQIKGKQDKTPVDKYRPYVLDLLNNVLSGVVAGEYQYDLKKMSIFHGSNGFGNLFDVSESKEQLPSGNWYVILNEKESYLTDNNANILADFQRTDTNVLTRYHINEKVENKKHLREDFRIILTRFSGIDEDFYQKIYNDFGFHITSDTSGANPTLKQSIHDSDEHSHKLIAQDLLFRAIRDNFHHHILIIDGDNHPVISISTFANNKEFFVGLNHDTREWTNAIPLLLKIINGKDIKINTSFSRVLKIVGYLDQGDEHPYYMPISEIIQYLKPYYKTPGREWYIISMHRPRYENWMMLIIDNKPVAALKLAPDGKTHVEDEKFILDGVDDAFHATAPNYALDIMELIEETPIEITEDYTDDPFLLQYDILVDRFDNMRKIDWEQEVIMTSTYYNELGDEIKTEKNTTTLNDASDAVGIQELGYEMQLFLQSIDNGGIWEEKNTHDESDSINSGDLREFYDEPDEYLSDIIANKRWKKKRLPFITKEEISVWRA